MNRQWQKVLFTGLIVGSTVSLLVACRSTESVQLTTETAQVLEPSEQIPAAEKTAERVVSLTSLGADLVATLNAPRLIGIPGSPILQQDSRFADIPTVSEGRTEPDLEEIIALKPDLVIGAKGFHDKALQRLEELNIPILAIEINSWDNLRSYTTTLASVLEADAAPILARYDACLAQPPKPSSALVLVSRQPILAPNKNSWAGDFLSQLNIQNLAADLQGQSEFEGYVTLSAEKVIEADPDSVMVVETGEDLLAALKTEPFWNQLKATKDGNVFSFDYFGLVNPGSIASIEATCAQLKNERPSK